MREKMIELGFTVGHLGGGCMAYTIELDSERYAQAYTEALTLPVLGRPCKLGTFESGPNGDGLPFLCIEFSSLETLITFVEGGGLE